MLAVGNTDNQALAWKFIEAVMSPDVQSQFAKYNDVVPCAKNAIGEEALKAKPYLAPELAQFQAGPISPVPAGFESQASEFEAIALKAVTNALQGGQDPAAALAAAQKELEATFK